MILEKGCGTKWRSVCGRADIRVPVTHGALIEMNPKARKHLSRAFAAVTDCGVNISYDVEGIWGIFSVFSTPDMSTVDEARYAWGDAPLHIQTTTSEFFQYATAHQTGVFICCG